MSRGARPTYLEFLTSTQSRFASVVLDGDLGPASSKPHLILSLYLNGSRSNALRLRFEAFQGSETRELMGGREEKTVPPMRE